MADARRRLLARSEQPASEWCHCFNGDAIQFCEQHQCGWCVVCDKGECPECRSERSLGEPEEVDDDL